ncbi:MAG TPA: tetratricopeptide repeat protein, partial [Thermoanaerobaculia bacterium]|nr:tetratricopeptide repeat protein [Thermoanaerobaculia bacterium]
EAKKLAESLVAADPADTDAVSVRDRASEQLRLIAEQRLEDAQAAANREGATDADRLELAGAYFSAGRYREAADLYAKLPDSVMNREARTRHARALTWAGQHAAAEVKYSALLAEESTPELELEYGRMLSWMGAERASLQRLQHAHDLLGTEDSVIALANARAWSGDREGAIRLLDEYTVAHADAREASTLLSEMRASPDIRIERIDKLIGLDPYNLALRMERARMLYDAGRYGETMRTITFIRENARQEIVGLDELQRRTEERRREELVALDEKRRTMLGDPPMYSSASANAEQVLDLAKAYTSLGGYDQAIDLYDAYLDSVPDDDEARLNYARVLSWDRRYDASQRQYVILLKDDPNRPDVRLEYAQTLTYDREYVPAVRTLRTLTDVSDSPRAYLYEDVPPQAHFRLGQIYRWFGWRDTAVEQQNQALMLDSGLTDAHRELIRARYTMPGSRIEARYTDEVNSNDFQTRRGDLSLEHWLNPRLAIDGGVGRHNFEQRGLEADANVAHIGAAFRQHDRLTLRGRVGMTFWESGNLGTRPYFGLGATYLPNIQSRAALDYNHYDLIYDVSNMFTLAPRTEPSLNDPLSIDDLRAHYDWNSGGFWSALADASYGRISDANSRQSLHGLLSFRVLRSPFVAIKADGRMLSYDRRSDRYWSPDDYRSLAGVLQVGQDINDRIFWTAELKIGKSWDGDRSSDLRAWAARVTIPVGDAFDVIGSYNYGRSGRFESLVGDPEFATYWQRSFYVGVRIKRLRASDDRESADRYYYDNRVLAGSDAVPPEVR